MFMFMHSLVCCVSAAFGGDLRIESSQTGCG